MTVKPIQNASYVVRAPCKTGSHMHAGAQFFGESLGDVLVQVPQATPGRRIQENVSDCPRHSSIGVLDEDTRLLAAMGRKGILQHPDGSVRRRVRCDGLADDTRPKVIVDDGEHTDGHTVPVFHGRIVVKRHMHISIPQRYLRVRLRGHMRLSKWPHPSVLTQNSDIWAPIAGWNTTSAGSVPAPSSVRKYGSVGLPRQASPRTLRDRSFPLHLGPKSVNFWKQAAARVLGL